MKLQRRQKRNDESESEYYYAVLTIASKGDIDELALIHHIVNGLPGPAHTKYHLRESPNLTDLKKKLNVYRKSRMDEQLNERKIVVINIKQLIALANLMARNVSGTTILDVEALMTLVQ